MTTKTASAILATWILASLLVACRGGGPPAECPPNVRGTSAIVSAPGTEAVSWTISAGGAISGTNGTGCNFTGAVTPRTDVAGVFNITVTFGGRLCALGTSTVRGIAIYDPSPGHFLTAAVNPGRTDSFITSVVKQ